MSLEYRFVMIVGVALSACHDVTEPTPLQDPPPTIGASFTADLDRSFVVGSAIAIDNASFGHSVFPDVAAIDRGAVAVWAQSVAGSPLSIFANRSVDGDWGTTVEIDYPAFGNARNPQIASTGSDRTLAVWQQFNSSRRVVILASPFDGQSWNEPTVVDDQSLSHSNNPQAAIANSDAWVVWEQFEEQPDPAATRTNVMANYFDGASWGPAVPIDDPARHNAFEPHIAAATNGNAVATWQQLDVDANRLVVMANAFRQGAWSGAVAIDDPALFGSSNPRVATSVAGLTVTVWEQFDGSRLQIMANVFDGQVWSGAVTIDNPSLGNSIFPQVAMDPGGNATAVWQQFDPTTDRLVIMANHLASTAWTNPVVVDDATRSQSQPPQVGMGIRGQATVVWAQFDVESDRLIAMANVFDGTRWGAPTAVDDPARSNSQNVQVAVDGNGNATIVWQQFDPAANRVIVMANSIRGATPADRVAALAQAIDHLASDGTLSPVLASTLSRPLDRALTRLSNGQPLLAAINLNLFIALVRLYEAFDLLSADDAEALTDIARAVVDELLMIAQPTSTEATASLATTDRHREGIVDLDVEKLDRELISLVHDGRLTRFEARSLIHSIRDLMNNRPQ